MIRPPYKWRDRLFKMAWPLSSAAWPQLFFFFSITGASQHVHPKKRGGKKNSKNKKKGFFFGSTLKFSIILHRIKYHFFIVLVYIMPVDGCMYVCIMYVLCGCFLVLLHYWFSKSRRRMEE